MAIVRVTGNVPPYEVIARPEIKTIQDLKGKSIALVTKWNVEGTVKMPFKMPVKGVVDTDLKGARG